MNKEIIIQEIDSLNRTLDFVQEEQSFIKRKLSGYLENELLSEALLWAELLHQEILNRETAIQLLKKDILNLKNKIKSKQNLSNIIDPSVVGLYKKHKQQVGYIEKEFLLWKNSTNEKFEITLN
jgi:hypothetical protein